MYLLHLTAKPIRKLLDLTTLTIRGLLYELRRATYVGIIFLIPNLINPISGPCFPEHFVLKWAGIAEFKLNVGIEGNYLTCQGRRLKQAVRPA
jgi:hypothetical protein